MAITFPEDVKQVYSADIPDIKISSDEGGTFLFALAESNTPSIRFWKASLSFPQGGGDITLSCIREIICSYMRGNELFAVFKEFQLQYIDSEGRLSHTLSIRGILYSSIPTGRRTQGGYDIFTLFPYKQLPPGAIDNIYLANYRNTALKIFAEVVNTFFANRRTVEIKQYTCESGQPFLFDTQAIEEEARSEGIINEKEKIISFNVISTKTSDSTRMSEVLYYINRRATMTAAIRFLNPFGIQEYFYSFGTWSIKPKTEAQTATISAQNVPYDITTITEIELTTHPMTPDEATAAHHIADAGKMVLYLFIGRKYLPLEVTVTAAETTIANRPDDKIQLKLTCTPTNRNSPMPHFTDFDTFTRFNESFTLPFS